MDAVVDGDLTALRRLVEDGGSVDSQNPMYRSGGSFVQNSLLIDAARQGDLSIFEYLVEHGAMIPSEEAIDGSVAIMLQRRQDWISLIAVLAHEWRIPPAAIRVIHDYVVGFNWSAVNDALMHAFAGQQAGK